MNEVTETMIGLRTALKYQIESNKRDREEKKNNLGKLLDQHKSIIANASSADERTKALALNENLLEAMIQSSLVESRSKDDAIINRNSRRVN